MAEDDDPHNSFTDQSFGIGQNTDGSFNVFPASELAQRIAARERDEEATSYAIEQSEKGFPDELREEYEAFAEGEEPTATEDDA